MTTRTQQLAVVATCLLAALTNAGAVEPLALGIYLLPGVLLAASLGSVLAARRMFGTALVLGGLLVLGWSELVNVWSGSAEGPVARATFVAGACTLVAVAVAQWRSPGLFLVAVAGSVSSALLLGAGSEVRIVVVGTAVAAALTLGSIERTRRNWAAPPGREPSLVVLSLLVGAAAAGVVLLQVHLDARPPRALASGLAYPGIKPPWTDPLGMIATRATPAPPPASSDRPQLPREATTTKVAAPAPARTSHTTTASHSRVWLYGLGAVVLVVAIALLARLVAVRLAWRRLRRRLQGGAVAHQITGAWTWARMRLEACRLPLPAAVSPDVLAAGGVVTELPTEVFTPLQALATSTTTAAFAWDQPLGPVNARVAWRAASEAESSARRLLTRRARLRLAFRGPARTAGAR